MDIAAMSTAMAMQSLQSAISTTMLQKTMNQDAMSANAIIESMNEITSAQQEPSFGHILDVRA